jgi:ribosome-associated heat shock protein Hsp15
MAKTAALAHTDSVRVDKWLWATRFFKTRSVALDAVRQGHVQVNGVRPKPSRAVRLADQLEIRRGEESFVIVVSGLAAKRGSAAQAALLYEETAESKVAREVQAKIRQAARLSEPTPPRARPDKHARQHIRQFLGK